MSTSVTAMTPGWVVHKFGGTSVANAERYRAVADILRHEAGARIGVVVSAMSKVTDALIELVDLARQRNDSYFVKLDALKERHVTAAHELLGSERAAPLCQIFDADFNVVAEVLRGVWHARYAPESTIELVSGHGEVWSAQLLDAYLRARGVSSAWLDARQVLVVEPTPSAVHVDYELTRPKLAAWLGDNPVDVAVITGFIAMTREGIPCTLKRNGSDYSASIFGALLGATSITIWTDVDGVLSADPRLVPEAEVLDELSYLEASELAYFGAKVVHPSTMVPAIQSDIPIHIRNTFRPTLPGTKIHSGATAGRPVKGFSTRDGMALVNVEGTGMLGVPGVAQRLFGALRDVGVSVVMISQASSEQSICFAVKASQAALTKTTVERAFFAELHHGQIHTISVLEGSSILAAVGDGMAHHPGIAGTFFTALGRAGVNVRAIAQGSSERNISAVIATREAGRALRAVHSAFYLSPQTLSIGVIGCGLIGGTLLDQLNAEVSRLREEFNIDLRVRAVMGQRKMLLGEPQVDLTSWRERYEDATTTADLEQVMAHVNADHLPHAVLIDCTASADIAARYADWLATGFHVVTANKKANASSMEHYRRMRGAARKTRRHFLYETNVGAGLPIINTLRDLVQTGDLVLRIEGVLSGTMSYLFHALDAQTPFSAVVREAMSRGYTEPDPRDDLSGTDVARKLVILAREAGLPLDLEDILVEDLVPEALRHCAIEEFLAALETLDAPMEARRKQAAEAGMVLRYVGVVNPAGESNVALRAYPADSPLGRVDSGNNIVAFTTMRYRPQPLVVQGPGAGPEVTAGGVFADLLRLASYLGAHP